MNCPKCGGKTTVHGSYADCESVQRRRLCKECGHVFFTAEYEVESEAEKENYYECYRHYARERQRKHRRKLRENVV